MVYFPMVTASMRLASASPFSTLMRRLARLFALSIALCSRLAADDKDIRDAVIATKCAEEIFTQFGKLLKEPTPQIEKQLIKQIYHFWLLYKSDYRFKDVADDFEEIRFQTIKKNIVRANLKLPEDDPVGWAVLLKDGAPIKEAINGSEMLPARYAAGGLETYKASVKAFSKWWNE